ncbi:carboxylesterase/lipase family protein [Paenibacillus sp. UASWS1643]|uniref:carboxylesterase/lipase family protein n=1 Tax=Paenibacillus sp. UASWS1643 TaxID=2580422 RepID=UPI00123B08AD|nr:carboxylesterase family protein [Paenibacillus sp. UASWS1643]KAA8748184.1 carboxylesterase family protein [Paenibacillus sp. UASWS1643]
MKTIKRSIAVATILGLCVSALPAYAAGNTGPSSSAAMDKLIQSELIRGSGQGVNAAYLNKKATRIQAAVLYLRLSGLEKEALAYQGSETYDDAAQAGKVLQPVVGYLKQHPYVSEIVTGTEKFEPNAPLTAEGYAEMLLKVLGYEAGSDYEQGTASTYAAGKGIKALQGKGASQLTNRLMAEATAQALQIQLKNGSGTLEQNWLKHKEAGAFKPQTVQQTKYGAIDGKTYKQYGTLGWLGVPYAKPPVGELRWKAPQEPASWTGTRSVKEFAANSLQISGKTTAGSEDSLYLNIWRPDTTSSKLPVMVFLHGGGNMTGSGKDFQGEQLARSTNSIIISVNYRLGALGFFENTALKTGNALDDSGNYGLLDAFRALEWVQDNIEGFGGDTGNVTLAGQSAGARDVLATLISPLSKGLYQKVIAFSGGLTTASPEEGEQKSEDVLVKLLVQEGKAANAEEAKAWIGKQSQAQLESYLRALPADKLVTAFGATAIRMDPFPHLFRDGTVIPKEGFDAINNDNYKKVPVLLGSLETEFSGFAFGDPNFSPSITDETLFTDKTKAEQYAAALKYGSEAYAGFNAERVAEQLTSEAGQPPVYAYRFAWGTQPGVISERLLTLLGAPHGADMDFYTGHADGIAAYFPEGYFSDTNKPGRDELSTAMAAYLKQFLYTGNPGTGGSPDLAAWTPWTKDAQAPIMRLDASNTTAEIGMSTQYNQGKEAVMAKMKKELPEETYKLLTEKVFAGRFFWE